MPKSVLLDTNLLVVLVVGLLDPSIIGIHKRTKNYTPDDFLALRRALDNYQELWITSQSVAETSNLVRQTNEAQAEQLLTILSELVSSSKESNMDSRGIFTAPCVLKLGVTDAGIAKKSKRVTNLLTADLDLYLEVSGKFSNAINFNHIRTGAWSFNGNIA
ncbi:hypothetical protein MKP05_19350 [Halomonas sp. EGI 63088]|uniref:PIN domain-containing protein n=1 Tax=Halomonas flagellata TaxID=2920385 RepID=A0ABS9RZL7_9GAMM|nr:hypothetical protein [Halomonas flagellata]MCH4565259.1 hypothetical protein [Halomonas flagellata]